MHCRHVTIANSLNWGYEVVNIISQLQNIKCRRKRERERESKRKREKSKAYYRSMSLGGRVWGPASCRAPVVTTCFTNSSSSPPVRCSPSGGRIEPSISLPLPLFLSLSLPPSPPLLLSLTCEAAGSLAALGVECSDGVSHLQLLLSHSGQTSLRYTPVAESVGSTWCWDLAADLDHHNIIHTYSMKHSLQCKIH